MAMPYSQTRWSLDDLFPASNSKEMQAAFEKLQAYISAFEDRRQQLTTGITSVAFLDIIQQYEELNALAYRVSGFSSLNFAADTQDQAAQTFVARVDKFMAEIQNRTLFFSLWWKELDEGVANRLMDDAGDYAYWLEEMRHFKPHTLSEAEEKIINIKDVTGINALTNLYDALTNRYVFKIEDDGELKELTRGELMVYAYHQNPDMRARAYQELYRVYAEDGPILGQMYQTLVRDWRNEQVDLRNFNSPLAARNLINDIPDEVVDTLLGVCERNTGVFQRYFHLKARWLGTERLRRYDIYAPVAQAKKTYPFGEAAEMVLDSFAEFDPQVASLAKKVFDEQHIDSEIRKGKRSGAFCATVNPKITPWVLINYQSKPRDVATLAHELGHAIHSQLAAQHSLFTFHSSLPLAETASTFGEMMLIDKLLATESDENVRRDLLFKQVDDAYATIMRQAYFALFERQAHDMVHNNATVDELAGAYVENLQNQFSDAVEISDEFRWEWVSIPHIYHVPFYVYAYTFGQLLVLSLYQQFLAEGDAFKPRYLKILSAGGSQAPTSILSAAGIDITKADFWQGGFDVVVGMLDKLENIPVK
jgi:oligoendopeptidase F